MKIILTADVSGLGSSGDIVEVRDGYARNYLLPRNLAIVATKGAEKQVHAIRRAQENRRVRDLEHARELKEQLQNLESVQLSKKVSKKGKLFGSISESDVVSAVRQAGGPALDKRAVDLKGHIKSLGKHSVSVRLHPDVQASFDLEIRSAS
ncbi:LSU ribosomal protein L9P [Halopolyspora algeriensis]|uniref:Large ribosomal subunit protein bL9 n=1 Tax=Halopolyspora algeriensis TaxID=1500506 RepID=A0A368VYL5_9ACTN|nr:50S ribosomal protein L9 [Halopolyspora algeriensis]RCW47077.1 LSU ribosomal protein L9P [Halopolyspora algeriensis]TQM48164.1 LSU ribosomal protein L9P [Halopolyspora algeriensis]